MSKWQAKIIKDENPSQNWVTANEQKPILRNSSSIKRVGNSTVNN